MSSCYCGFEFSIAPHCVHLVLHSFPTRRSSDLDYLLSREHPFGLPLRLLRVRSRRSRRAAGGDRKSTRLNSSHQINSYAGFFLKKKTRPGRRDHRSPELRQPFATVERVITVKEY